MDLAPSEDVEALRPVVRSFVEKVSPEAEVRRLMDTDRGHDPAVWRRMAGELGLTGLGVPEEHGGSGGGFREIAVVLEEMGRALMCAPYLSTVVLAAGALLHSADEDAQAAYLPGIAAGETTATLALAEGDARWDDPAGVSTAATRTGSGWELTGKKLFVLDGLSADLVLVAARTGPAPEDLGLFAVEGGAPGLVRAAMTTLDPTRKQARLELGGVPARLVGPADGAWPLIRKVLDLAAVGLACEQTAGAERVLEMAVEYAKTRHQFARPIGSFQAIKHRCADMALGIDAARSAAAYAVWAASGGPAELPVAAAMAKATCSEAFVFAAAENVQVHGGIGFTWEHPAHLYFRRAKSGALLFGDPAHHRDRLVGHLLDADESEAV
ncbi:acyl-CoA dehydrogenase family protein [Actinomadura vinacea]|uniref:Acyl-CoA dehydrogenase family protein n=2 Tax=Actinomadura vinacea TaxID=115336 RepID=A0ABN3KEE0_9ACTN